MENKENRAKLPSCMVKGPAPVYKLQTLVGYDGHCLSRERGPAYTMRPRTGIQMQTFGPGPQYNIAKLTNYGLDKAPAYTIRGREPFKSKNAYIHKMKELYLKKGVQVFTEINNIIKDLGPGPGAHFPELCPPLNHNVRAPAYTIKSRYAQRMEDSGPGPNAYYLPTCIGPKIPDKIAQGAFSISGIRKMRQEDIGPGPAAYASINCELIKRSSPAFSLKWRTPSHEGDVIPGPEYYSQYYSGKRAPMYSFGIRHSECTALPITSLDED